MGQRYYFNNTELTFTGPDVLQDVLKMHAMTESHAHAVLDDGDGYAFVEFDDTNQVTDAGFVSELTEPWVQRVDADVKQDMANARPFDFPPDANRPFAWVPETSETPNDQSFFGGKPPPKFQMPMAGFASGFQYLGFLANADLPEPVHGDGLHIIYPMMVSHPHLFLDIAVPTRPELIPLDRCKISHGGAKLHDAAAFDVVTYPEIEALFRPGDQVSYERQNVSRRAISVEQPGDADASHPHWIQHPEIPICPVTHEPMHFLGMIGTGAAPISSAVVDRARATNDRSVEDMFWGLMFWGGNWPAYLFYHPTGNTLAIHPQAT